MDTLIQNFAELIRGLPDWVYIPMTIGLVVGLPVLMSFAHGGDK